MSVESKLITIDRLEGKGVYQAIQYLLENAIRLEKEGWDEVVIGAGGYLEVTKYTEEE